MPPRSSRVAARVPMAASPSAPWPKSSAPRAIFLFIWRWTSSPENGESGDAAEVEQGSGASADGGFALGSVAEEFGTKGDLLVHLALDEQAGEGKIFVSVAIARG